MFVEDSKVIEAIEPEVVVRVEDCWEVAVK